MQLLVKCCGVGSIKHLLLLKYNQPQSRSFSTLLHLLLVDYFSITACPKMLYSCFHFTTISLDTFIITSPLLHDRTCLRFVALCRHLLLLHVCRMDSFHPCAHVMWIQCTDASEELHARATNAELVSFQMWIIARSCLMSAENGIINRFSVAVEYFKAALTCSSFHVTSLIFCPDKVCHDEVILSL